MTSSTTFVHVAYLLILVSTSNAITSETISKICSRAINPKLCFNLLNSNPSIAKADLKGVGRIVLDISTSKAKQTKSIIPSLASRATDPVFRQRYNGCIDFYDDVLAEIGDAKKALAANDPRTLNVRVSAAQTDIDNCLDDFPSAPADSLVKDSKDVFDTLSIVLVISNLT